jgi:hypothetical protein
MKENLIYIYLYYMIPWDQTLKAKIINDIIRPYQQITKEMTRNRQKLRSEYIEKIVFH